MPTHIMTILTYFGDSMLLLPTAVIIAVLLYWKNDDRRVVLFWLLAFGCAGFIVSLSKIAFLGYGIGSARFNFTGFSGHSAMASTLWPVMLWLLSARLSSVWRKLMLSVGYLIPLIVGISRLELNAHSVSEVVAGLILGYTLSTAFLISQRATRPRGFSLAQLCLVLLLPMLLLGNGQVATTQQFLQRLSVQLAGIDHAWTREDLLNQGR